MGTIELNHDFFICISKAIFIKNVNINQSIHLINKSSISQNRNGIKALKLTKTLKILSYHIIKFIRFVNED